MNLDANSQLPFLQAWITFFQDRLPACFVEGRGFLGFGLVFELFPQRNHTAGLETNCDCDKVSLEFI